MAGIRNLDFIPSNFTGSIDNVSVKEYLGQEVVPDSGCGSWLFEPQSTNLFLKSEPTSAEGLSIGVSYESFDWGIGFNNCVRYPNNSTLYVHYGGTCLANTSYTLSYYIKMDNGEQPIYGTDFSHRIGDTLGTSPILTNMGNGVYRVSETKISSTSNLTRNGVIKSTSNSVNGFRVTALQLEQQSYATSYIPTAGTTVTRNQETCINATPEINSEEGVLYAEISALALAGGDSRISLSNGTLNNRVTFAYSPNPSKAYIIIKMNGISVINDLNLEIGNHLENKKIAISYKSGDTKVFLNGTEIKASTILFSGATLNDLSFESANNSVDFFGNTKDLQVYTKALSDAELIKLTT